MIGTGDVGRDLAGVQQILPRKHDRADRRERIRHAVDSAAVDRAGPGVRRDVGEHGIVLDRVAREEFGQVGELRLQQLRQTRHVGVQLHRVREVATGDNGCDLFRVPVLVDHVQFEVQPEPTVELVPVGVLRQRRRERRPDLEHRRDRPTRAGLVLDRRHRFRKAQEAVGDAGRCALQIWLDTRVRRVARRFDLLVVRGGVGFLVVAASGQRFGYRERPGTAGATQHVPSRDLTIEHRHPHSRRNKDAGPDAARRRRRRRTREKHARCRGR